MSREFMRMLLVLYKCTSKDHGQWNIKSLCKDIKTILEGIKKQNTQFSRWTKKTRTDIIFRK